MNETNELQNPYGNTLPAELRDLQEEARGHLANAKAPSTRRAYASDWKQFETWCVEHAVEALPAEPETLVYYLTMLGQTKKASTIKRKIVAISQAHAAAGHDSPTKTSLVRNVWEGIQRGIGVREEGKEALWLHELRRVIEALPPDKLIGIRDRALLVLGWAGALRRSELVGLHAGDIGRTRDGLVLRLHRSKTDQKGEGQEVALPFGSNPLTCPVRSLDDWLAAAGITEGPVFRRVDRHSNVLGGLTPQSVRLIVRKRCDGVGLDPER